VPFSENEIMSAVAPVVGPSKASLRIALATLEPDAFDG